MIFFVLFTLVLSKPIEIERGNEFDDKYLSQNYSDFILNDSKAEVKISKTAFARSSSYMLIDVTPNGRTIVTLLYNNKGIKKTGSFCIVSNNAGITFKEYGKEHFDENFEIDYFEITDRVINLISYRKNRVYVFSHNFILLYKTGTGRGNDIDKYFNHPVLDSFIAAITTDECLIISINGGGNWTRVSTNIVDFAWIPSISSEYLIVTKSANNTTSLFVKSANNPSSSNLIKNDVVKIIVQEKNIFVLFKHLNRFHAGHVINNNYIQRLFIPGTADIVDFSIVNRYKDEIMVAVTFSNGVTNLYQGSLNTIKFVRLLNRIHSRKKIDEDDRCYDVAYYSRLPGFILANVQEFAGSPGYITIISFNHGVKWQPVKVGIYEDGKPAEECASPNCSFLLHFNCGKHNYLEHSLQQSDLAPYILASQAQYLRNGQLYKGLFTSTDAGYSWKLALKGGYLPGMINEGGVLFATPTYTSELSYTLDEGKTWKNIKTDFGEHIIAEIGESDFSRLSYKLIGGSWRRWFVIILDFSDIFKRECEKSDYEVMRPSTSSISHCFMGQKYSLYRKKQASVCKNVLEKFEPVFNSTCPCTSEDFGCDYAFTMLNGKCIVDFEAEKIDTTTENCWLGRWIIVSSGQAGIAYDKCERSHYNVGHKHQVCGITKADNFVILMKGTRLSFYTFYKNEFLEIGLPKTFRFPTAVGRYTIDVVNSCLYYLSNKNIVRKACWDDIDASQKLTDTIYIVEGVATHIDFDIVGSNLVYTSTSGLSIKNVANGKTKTILNEYTVDVSFLRVVSEKGYILLGQHDKNVLNIISFTGTLISNISLNSTLLNGAYDAANYKIYALTNDGLYVIDADTPQKYPFVIPADIVDFGIFNGQLLFATSNSIQYNGNVYQQQVVRGLYIKNSTAYKIRDCAEIACSDLCIPQPRGNVTCDCPDQMELSGGRCVCKKEYPNCLSCKANEFDCGSGECISDLKRCDGYLDCTNGRDEAGCKFTCLPVQFACKSEQKCIEVTSICDGIWDCLKGEDELNCPKLSNCTEKQFTCANHLCIPKEKKCNGKNDCGDFSDEYQCPGKVCSGDEFKCNDGSCIPLEFVCNEVFDCMDWEDEAGCHVVPVRNKSCEFKCSNGVCINSTQVCDRVAQCSLGEDELNCEYPNECANGYVSCPQSSGCIRPTEMCDGKMDCPDGSDEYYCKGNRKCDPPFTFQCNNNYQCVSNYAFCDSVVDCDDGSDEPKNCILISKVYATFAYQINSTAVYLKWWVRRPPADATYVINLYNKTSRVPIQSFTTSHFTANLTIPQLCITYGVTVQIQKSPNSIASGFFRLTPTVVDIPKNVIKNDRKLSWTEYDLKCVSRIYYVECVSLNRVSVRNFTKNSVFRVPSGGICYVRACPKKTVGPFCSSLVQATFSNLHIVRLSMTVLFLVVGMAILVAAGYLIYRRFVSKLINKYTVIRNFEASAKADTLGSLSDVEIDDPLDDAIDEAIPI